MKVWIDITSSEYIAFYKRVISEFLNQGCKVYVTTTRLPFLYNKLKKQSIQAKEIGFGINFLGSFVKENIEMIRGASIEILLESVKPNLAFSLGESVPIFTASALGIPIVYYLDNINEVVNTSYTHYTDSIFLIPDSLPEQIFIDKGLDQERITRYKGNANKISAEVSPSHLQALVKQSIDSSYSTGKLEA